jgi:hypothetical protein
MPSMAMKHLAPVILFPRRLSLFPSSFYKVRSQHRVLPPLSEPSPSLLVLSLPRRAAICAGVRPRSTPSTTPTPPLCSRAPAVEPVLAYRTPFAIRGVPRRSSCSLSTFPRRSFAVRAAPCDRDHAVRHRAFEPVRRSSKWLI